VPEPVAAWESSNLLRLSYEKPDQYLFPAQCEFFRTRIDAFLEAFRQAGAEDRPVIFISERSTFSDKIFVNTQVALGRFDPLLSDTYFGMWKHFQRLLPVPQPDAFVYLRPTLDACMDRMKDRARSSENTVTTGYQEALRQAHDAEFASGTATMPDGTTVPCELMETNDNFRDSPEHAERMAQQLITLIYRLKE
jgi:deoxyadenosine/deoxycytidine kinase